MGGCCQCVDGDESQSRRTVKKNVVVNVGEGVKQSLENPLPVEHHLKLQINSCHVESARYYVKVRPNGIDWKICLFPNCMVYDSWWNTLHKMSG